MDCHSQRQAWYANAPTMPVDIDTGEDMIGDVGDGLEESEEQKHNVHLVLCHH